MDYTFSSRIGSLRPSAIREILKVTQDPSVISFAAGNPSAETFPVEQMRKIADGLFTQSAASALQYGISEGFGPLREQTVSRLGEKFGAVKGGDELIITSGGQQAIELTAKVLCNEGDTVIAEDPSFIGALNAFRSYGLRLEGVPLESDGMSLEILENKLKHGKNVRFIYVIPTFQNPAGITTSLEKRRAILALAEKYGVLVLEDSPYFELRYSGEYIPPIKSLDEGGRVIFAGSYSKIFSPGMRVGYALAPREIISKLTVAKQVSDVHTNLFFSMLVSEFLSRHDVDAHIASICSLYGKKRDFMLEGIRASFPKEVSVSRPDGGLFIWGELPAGFDGFELCRRLSQKKVAAVPGISFSTDESGTSPGFRLNFSLPSMEQIETGIGIMGGVIGDYLSEGKAK